MLALIGISLAVVIVLVYMITLNGTQGNTANTPVAASGSTVTPNATQIETSFLTQTAGLARISLQDAKAAFDASTATFIDAREKTASDPQLSYDAGHVKGAINIPYTNPTTQLAALSKTGNYIVYCQ